MVLLCSQKYQIFYYLLLGRIFKLFILFEKLVHTVNILVNIIYNITK